MRNVDAQFVQLGVVARDLLKPRLDVANVGDLAAQVEVYQSQHVELAQFLESLDELHELSGVESELRFFAAALRPAAGPFGRQLDAHAGLRRDAEILRRLQQYVEFAQLLHHDEDVVSQLLAHEGEPHELFIFVAVADDDVFGALRKAEHRLQFRFGAAFQSYAVFASELDDFLHHVALLVDLDGIDRGVAARVVELPNGRCERFAQRFDAALEDVGESQQDREWHALRFEIDREFEEVERAFRRFGVGADNDMSGRVDVEEAGAPAVDVVQGLGIMDAPRRGLRRGGCSRGSRGGGSRGRRSGGGNASARHGKK